MSFEEGGTKKDGNEMVKIKVVFLFFQVTVIEEAVRYIDELHLALASRLTNNKGNMLGPVVQSIVSLTTSLRCQLVQFMPTTLSNTLLFFVGKM